jgi:hypothetical protein
MPSGGGRCRATVTSRRACREIVAGSERVCAVGAVQSDWVEVGGGLRE